VRTVRGRAREAAVSLADAAELYGSKGNTVSAARALSRAAKLDPQPV
jgi:hypothetical protein